MVNSWASPITNGVIMERIVLRIAAEIGEIILWTHSAGITTNLIESSSRRKRTAGCFLSVSIHADHSKYLLFEWKSELWEFSCLPFELSSAPRVYTKVMKLLIGKIRSQGIRSVIDLDNMAVSETVSADPVSGLHNWLVKYNVLFASGKAKQTYWKGLGHLTPF